jgi:hypothetical protein
MVLHVRRDQATDETCVHVSWSTTDFIAMAGQAAVDRSARCAVMRLRYALTRIYKLLLLVNLGYTSTAEMRGSAGRILCGCTSSTDD